MNEDEILEGLSQQEWELVLAAKRLFERANMTPPQVGVQQQGEYLGALGTYSPFTNLIRLARHRHIDSYRTNAGYLKPFAGTGRTVYAKEDSTGTLAHELAHSFLKQSKGLNMASTATVLRDNNPNQTYPLDEAEADAYGLAIQRLLEGKHLPSQEQVRVAREKRGLFHPFGTERDTTSLDRMVQEAMMHLGRYKEQAQSR